MQGFENQRSNCQRLLHQRKSKGIPEKHLLLLHWLHSSLLTVWITTNCGKFLMRWEYQIILPASREICMQVKKQQLELDMEQWTGSKSGKRVRQGCILSPCLFNLYAQYIMQNARLDEAQAGSRLPGEISITSDMQMTPNGRKQRIKEPLDEGERGEWKSECLKLSIQKTKIIASGPITSWQIDGETMETVMTDFIFLDSKIIADSDCRHEIKKQLFLGRKAMTNLDNI